MNEACRGSSACRSGASTGAVTEARSSGTLSSWSAAQGGSLGRRTRQQLEEGSHPIAVELGRGGQLPQERSQLVPEQQRAGREEVGQRLLDVDEPLHVGDEAATLDREDEAVRCLRRASRA